jgi:hypothetical protein
VEGWVGCVVSQWAGHQAPCTDRLQHDPRIKLNPRRKKKKCLPCRHNAYSALHQSGTAWSRELSKFVMFGTSFFFASAGLETAGDVLTEESKSPPVIVLFVGIRCVYRVIIVMWQSTEGDLATTPSVSLVSHRHCPHMRARHQTDIDTTSKWTPPSANFCSKRSGIV